MESGSFMQTQFNLIGVGEKSYGLHRVLVFLLSMCLCEIELGCKTSSSCSLPKTRNDPLAITVESVATNKNALYVTLLNTTDKSLVVHNGDIPWKDRECLMLVPVVYPNCAIDKVSDFMPLSTLPFFSKTLQPGESIHGYVYLTDLRYNYDISKRTQRVYILWAYRPILTFEVDPDWQTGLVEVEP